MLIHNITVYTNSDVGVLENSAVLVEGTRIVAVGNAADMLAAHPDAERLDGGGRLLMPGFSNSHMHFYGMYARGINLNHTPTNFHEILLYLWWALDKVLDDEAVYYSTLIPSIGSIKKGVTSVIDHHASPNWCAGSLDQIEAGMAQVGLRGILCYETSDRDGKAIRDAGLAENERYIRKSLAAKANDPDHLFDGMMGLHASFSCDNDTLEQAVAIASGLERGCHIHMLEDFCDETFTQEKYGQGVVERLHQYGVLSDKSIAAHGIFLDDRGRGMLRDTNTMVVHQAQSNMNNAVGRADVFALLEQGITVGLGTDGMTPDVRRELMTGYLMHKHHVSDNNVGWGEFEQMGMRNNYSIFERISGQKIGKVEAGRLADLILVDYWAPTAFSAENFFGHLLFGMIDADVNTTIINGKVVMHDKVVLGIDEVEIAAKSREVAKRVWKRYADSA